MRPYQKIFWLNNSMVKLGICEFLSSLGSANVKPDLRKSMDTRDYIIQSEFWK